MSARSTALTIAAVVGGATVAAIVTGQVLAWRATRGPALRLPPPEAAPAAPGTPRWVVDVAGRASVPDRVVHPPIVVGDRLLVAGARIGYVALDLATGAIAWRRASGPELAAPLVLAPHDVVLVHACDDAVGVADGRAVVACFERIDPLDIAARSAGAIHATLADAAPCLTSMAPWRVRGDASQLVIARDDCALTVELPSGRAVAAPPEPTPPRPEPGAECGRTDDGTPWCQQVGAVEALGVRAPGLSVLAGAASEGRVALVVREDASLEHDAIVAAVDGAITWRWMLPAPAAPRATPIAITVDPSGVYAVFDSSRVAALAPP